MAQKMVARLKEVDSRSVGVQTEENGSEFCINLSSNKIAKIKYSKAFKSKVLSINVNKHKNLIITPPMWKTLRENLTN